MATWRLVLAGLLALCVARSSSERAATLRLAANVPHLAYFLERSGSVETRLRTAVLSACARLYDASFSAKCGDAFYTQLLQNMAYSLGADQI